MFEIEVINTKSNMPTLKINNIYLHSKFNPQKEAELFILNNYKPASLQILIGFGQGYIYEELRKVISSNERIIVIEPIENIVNEKINAHYSTYDQFKQFIDNSVKLLDKVNIIISINYNKLVPTKIVEILKVLNEKALDNRVIENTFKNFTNSWNENYIKNLKYARFDCPVSKLFLKYDMPIVIASGGPSLIKQIKLLKLYRSKIILIAAGTTINTLLYNDIEPDYVVSIDGGEVNNQHFQNITENNIRLIYCPTHHHGIRSKFKKGYYFLHLYENQIMQHYETYTNDQVDLFQGGSSVANAAFNLAFFMTTNKVALIGQDLAYTDGYTHAKGNLNCKKVDEQYKINRGILEKEGFYGELVMTDLVFLQMKEAFNKLVESYNVKDKVFNCTEGGLKIEKINQLPFKNFLEQFANTDNKHIEPEIIKVKYSNSDLLNLYENDVKNIKEVIQLLEKSNTILGSVKEAGYYKGEVLEVLEKIDNQLNKLVDKLGLARSFSFINLKAIKYYEINEKDEITKQYQNSIDQNIFLYSEMLKITECTLTYYNEIIKEHLNEFGS